MDGSLPVLRALHDRSLVEATLGRLGGGGIPNQWWDGATAYVLADLSAPPADDALGVALCGPVDASGEVHLLELSTRPGWPGAGQQLVSGVVSALRANGARRLVTVADGDRGHRGVLRRAGFRLEAVGSPGCSRLVLDL